MLNKHPTYVPPSLSLPHLGALSLTMTVSSNSATLLRTSEIPPDDIQLGESQFLQITAVAAEVDQSAHVFTRPDVPAYVRAYYLVRPLSLRSSSRTLALRLTPRHPSCSQHNETNTFSFARPLSKDAVARRAGSTDDPAVRWTEKTVFISEDSFPTVLRRSEVVEIRLIEISPVENAVHDVYSQEKELARLERRFRALVQSEQEGGIDRCVSPPRRPHSLPS